MNSISSLFSSKDKENKQSSSKPALRILCFGDSLTSGYASWGTISHPYSLRLSSLLSAAYPSLEVKVETDGRPGDVASGSGESFFNRIGRHFSTDKEYEWTIVLGGTNDLAYSYSPEVIYDALSKVWKVPLEKGGKVLACTVPDAGVPGTAGKKLKKKRDELNGFIKSYEHENFFVFDLNTAIPFPSEPTDEEAKFWDDNIHMTPMGYDLMGEKIAERLMEVIGRASGVTT